MLFIRRCQCRRRRPSPLQPIAAPVVGQRFWIVKLLAHQQRCWGIGDIVSVLGCRWGISSRTHGLSCWGGGERIGGAMAMSGRWCWRVPVGQGGRMQQSTLGGRWDGVTSQRGKARWGLAAVLPSIAPLPTIVIVPFLSIVITPPSIALLPPSIAIATSANY